MGAEFENATVDRLRELVHDVTLEKLPLAAEDNLFQLGVLDSLQLVKLVSLIEKEFSISVHDREMVPEYFLTLQRMAMLVSHKTQKEEAK